MGYVSSRLAPLAHPVTNFRALRQDLRRQRVEGRALVDPQNTYRPSVRTELRRMFTRPFPVETQTLMCNALLAAICWYLLPEAWRSWLFSEFRGPAGFALVMVGWMVADVTSTNLMGHDEEHALRALRSSDPHALHLFVRTKAIAIGLITGVCRYPTGAGSAQSGQEPDPHAHDVAVILCGAGHCGVTRLDSGRDLSVPSARLAVPLGPPQEPADERPLGSALFRSGLGAGYGADVAHVPFIVPGRCARSPLRLGRGSARCCVPTVAVFADFVGSGRD